MAARGIKSRPFGPSQTQNFLPNYQLHYISQDGVIIYRQNDPVSAGIGQYYSDGLLQNLRHQAQRVQV